LGPVGGVPVRQQVLGFDLIIRDALQMALFLLSLLCVRRGDFSRAGIWG
jgi:hypothetical protein